MPCAQNLAMKALTPTERLQPNSLLFRKVYIEPRFVSPVNALSVPLAYREPRFSSASVTSPDGKQWPVRLHMIVAPRHQHMEHDRLGAGSSSCTQADHRAGA